MRGRHTGKPATVPSQDHVAKLKDIPRRLFEDATKDLKKTFEFSISDMALVAGCDINTLLDTSLDPVTYAPISRRLFVASSVLNDIKRFLPDRDPKRFFFDCRVTNHGETFAELIARDQDQKYATFLRQMKTPPSAYKHSA